ncbi:MAG: winged helix-turn-helix domain-containing protein [Saprospiraceae bacterium]
MPYLFSRKTALPASLLLLGLASVFFAWRAAASSPHGDMPPSEKINLALRRTAHQLLTEAGDSTSRIPPVQQIAQGIWLVRLERTFNYDRLPELLQASFDLHGVGTDYDVAVLRCSDGELQLGYNAVDVAKDSTVPCGGRDIEAGCRNLQVTFASEPASSGMPVGLAWAFGVGSLLAAAFFFWKKNRPTPPDPGGIESHWLVFGNSRLDVANQLLVCGSSHHELTYRETKLLHLFANQPNQLLERSHILQHVWADEGVLVGRSVDVFVSRLRKLLRDDPSIRIAAVHGVGYRLEVDRLQGLV